MFAQRLSPDDVRSRLDVAFPGAQIDVVDLTGTQDHYHVTLVWSGFAGRGLLDQHRAVNAALAEELKGPIHALKLTTRAA